MHISVHSFGFNAAVLHIHYGLLPHQIPQSTIPVLLFRLVAMARPDGLLDRLRLQVRRASNPLHNLMLTLMHPV